jgi:hypothetical protein
VPAASLSTIWGDGAYDVVEEVGDVAIRVHSVETEIVVSLNGG